jgi:hypothetical protein
LLQQPFGNCQEDLVLPDFFYEVFVEREDDTVLATEIIASFN